MLSDDLEIVAKTFQDIYSTKLVEIDKADPNMVYAIGYAVGTILREVDNLKNKGR